MTLFEAGFVPVPGGRIFTLSAGHGPLLVFAHATGMCARAYLPLLGPLAAWFRVVAYDARGHGATELPADPAHVPADWLVYRADLAALVAALGGGPVHLVGHSMGATMAFEAAVEQPGLASSVTLIDPPMIPFAEAARWRAARDAEAEVPNPMAAQAARRRATFPSRAAARGASRGRGVVAGWSEEELGASLGGGLRPEGEGVRLACAPAWEAATFRGVSTTLEASFRAARLPFALLMAGEGSTVPPAEEAAVRAMHPSAPIRRFPGTGHFLPVTHADLVRPWLGWAGDQGALPDR
ncbi:MAG: alpha/beta fold hydrolase [Sphingomonadaceae bacterium]